MRVVDNWNFSSFKFEKFPSNPSISRSSFESTKLLLDSLNYLRFINIKGKRETFRHFEFRTLLNSCCFR